MRRLLPCALLLAATPVAAQMPATSPALRAAAATITPEDVSRGIHVIADDSMMGRDTPSRGLEMTAQYIADEFKRFGLKPGGENGTYLQRYAIVEERLNPEKSHVGFHAGKGHAHGGREHAKPMGADHAHVTFQADARLAFGNPGAGKIEGPVWLLAGPLDPARLSPETVKGHLVVIVVDYAKGPPPAAANQAVGALLQGGVKGIVIVSNRDSAQFAQRLAQSGRSRPNLERKTVEAGPIVVEVHERAVLGVLKAAKVDLAALRAGTSMVSRAVPDLTVMLDLRADDVSRVTAPNTIGIVEGSDPVLRNEYLVYSAHMDHDGIRPGRPDSIMNGADDDASGTIGVVELAEAFAQPGARPKRSVLFITVSGEEKGLWGSEHFANNPTVPAGSMIANINLDMIGRNWKDTIAVIGKEHSDLGATLNRVNAAHPELGMTAIDDIWPNERFYFRSDHYNFARKGIPILFFFNGVHADYHQPSDSPDKIDAEKESRILQLLFYLGQEVANAPERPKWKPESYKQIVEGAGR